MGAVQNHSPDANTNQQPIRYVGGNDRNVDLFVEGALDHPGTIEFFPQDWKTLALAMGSNVDAGSPSPYLHNITEHVSASGNAFTSGVKNPFVSFTLVDQQKTIAGSNFNREVSGLLCFNIQ